MLDIYQGSPLQQALDALMKAFPTDRGMCLTAEDFRDVRVILEREAKKTPLTSKSAGPQRRSHLNDRTSNNC